MKAKAKVKKRKYKKVIARYMAKFDIAIRESFSAEVHRTIHKPGTIASQGNKYNPDFLHVLSNGKVLFVTIGELDDREYFSALSYSNLFIIAKSVFDHEKLTLHVIQDNYDLQDVIYYNPEFCVKYNERSTAEEYYSCHSNSIIKTAFGKSTIFTQYEPVTLRLPGGRYTPDFMHVCDDGEVIFVEVKGSKKQRGYRDARSKLRAAASIYTFFTFAEYIKTSGMKEVKVAAW